MTSIVVLLGLGCSDPIDLPVTPIEPAELRVTATAIPSIINIGNNVGLIGDHAGGVNPIQHWWKLDTLEIGIYQNIEYTPDSIGEYTAWYFAQDNLGIIDSAFDCFSVVPEDSVIVHDTVTVTDTIIVTQVDTLIQEVIVVEYDTTVIVDSIPYPIYVTDTLIDTLWQYVYEVDTLWQYDTTYVYEIVHDTTVIYIDDVLYYEYNPWILEWGKREDTVYLSNPACYGELFFNRKTLGIMPDGMLPKINIDGVEYEEFIMPYGPESDWISYGPIEFPENATIVFKFGVPYYGKINVASCHDFMAGGHFFLRRQVKLP